MAQKRAEASIEGVGGIDSEFEEMGEEAAPRSFSVGEESAVSAFRLTGSPSMVGFCLARSLRLLWAVEVDEGGDCCAPLSWFVGEESAASALRLTGSPRRVGFSFARSLSFFGCSLLEGALEGLLEEDEED